MKKEEFQKTESLDEIIFENRNKEYGAYDLRTRYKKNLNRSMFIAFLFLVIVSGTPLLMAFQSTKIVDFPIDPGPIFEPAPDQEEKVIPPPPKRAVVENLEQKIRTQQPVVVETATEENTLDIQENLLAESSEELPEMTEQATPEVISSIDQNSKPEPGYLVEELPVFPGGDSALANYMKEKARYPELPKENGIEGIVHVEFIVNQDGSISGVTIANSIDPYLDAEAIRLISSMPKWEPGRMGGNPVRVIMHLPVRFILD